MRFRTVLTALATALSSVAVALPVAPIAEAAPGDPVPAVAGRRTIDGRSNATCVILATTEVQCWGDGDHGLIGDGGDVNRPRPATATGLSGVVDVSVSSNSACAVTDTNDLWCWGTDGDGELGNGPTETDDALEPQLVPGMAGTVDVAVGSNHVCAVKSDGTAWCWGDGSQWALGNGANDDVDIPTQVPGITDAASVTAGNDATCLLHSDGGVSCWGENEEGEVGNGTDDPAPLPERVPGITGAVDAVISDDPSTCALISDGTVKCWGSADDDWLGEGQFDPITIPFLDDAVAVRVADGAICAIVSDFSLWCAGGDDDLLPFDHPDDRETLDPTGITGVADFTLGDDHACVVLTTGDVQCWGDNRLDGAVGAGALSELDPTEVDGLGVTTSIDASLNTTCAIADGEIWCWGNNEDRLIADTDDDVVPTPSRVGTATDIVEVSVGRGHACVVNSSNKVACWGSNGDGQLGNGDTADRVSPTPVAGNFTSVSAGGEHTCAIRVNGAAACWGKNFDGQIGNGTASPTDIVVPTTIVDSGIDFTSISAGDEHTCGVQANQKVRCWGHNGDFQLGDGTDTDRESPVLVDDPVDDFGSVASATWATCAIRATGLSCWGNDDQAGGGGLGEEQSTPTDKTIGGSWTALDSESDFACAVYVGDGSVFCWGDAFNNKLTSAITGETHEPMQISDTSVSSEVTTGEYHACLLTTAGAVRCWGSNFDAQLGAASSFDAPQTVGVAGPALVDVEPTASTPPAPPVPAEPELFEPVAPARLLETRTAQSTIDGDQQGIGRLDAGEQVTVNVAGRASVPDDAAAVVINVTAIAPEANGFITAHGCLDPRPLASSLNYGAGTNLGNEIIVELDDSGDACIYTSAALHLTVDVAAYLPAGAGYRPVPPARLVDTRTSGAAETIDGRFEAEGHRLADSEYQVRIAGRGGISSNATAAVLNVTAINPGGAGFFTLHPCTDPRPTAASLNYIAGVNRGNELIAPLSADGDVCVYTSTATNLSIDVVGEVRSAYYSPVVPGRYLDTRPGQSGIAGSVSDDGMRSAGQTTRVRVAGIGDVPADATTVTVNVTSVAPQSVGYATVHACLPTAPNAASLNFSPGVNGGNEIVAELDADGDLCIFTSSPAHITVDIAGYTVTA